MFSLDLLRAIAILMITNSHMDRLYPVKALATGGMLGNELFFFISGFGLTLSMSHKRQPFGPWMLKRARRVMQPLLIVSLFLLLTGFARVTSAFDAFMLFSGFQYFWFLPVIVMFYVPLYFIIGYRDLRLSCALAIALGCAIYAFVYLTVLDLTRWSIEAHVWSKAPFYFCNMVLGVYASRYWREVRTRWFDFAGMAGAFAAYVVVTLLIRKLNLYAIQFVIHLIGVVWLAFMYRCSRLPALERLKDSRSAPVILFLSGYSLQIYLLGEFSYSNRFVSALHFPVNVLVFWLTVLPLAVIFRKIDIEQGMRFFSRRQADQVPPG